MVYSLYIGNGVTICYKGGIESAVAVTRVPVTALLGHRMKSGRPDAGKRSSNTELEWVFTFVSEDRKALRAESVRSAVHRRPTSDDMMSHDVSRMSVQVRRFGQVR